ncbi:PAS domain-containing protein [Nisaea sp.]|uniref:PAS domain-containing protein n=1 Tax=Nisaea sp. TaxID=2024842 RepID=UPI003B530232
MQPKQSIGIDYLDWVLEYWRSLRGDRSMPSRKDFDPTVVPSRILPNLIMVEVHEETKFLYRLYGTAHVDVAGLDFTGSYLHELPERGGYRDYLAGIYEQLVQEKVPLFTESTYQWKQHTKRSTQRLMVPFSNDDRTVHHILSAQVFDFVWSDDRSKINLFDFDGFGEARRYTLEG